MIDGGHGGLDSNNVHQDDCNGERGTRLRELSNSLYVPRNAVPIMPCVLLYIQFPTWPRVAKQGRNLEAEDDNVVLCASRPSGNRMPGLSKAMEDVANYIAEPD